MTIAPEIGSISGRSYWDGRVFSSTSSIDVKAREIKDATQLEVEKESNDSNK